MTHQRIVKRNLSLCLVVLLIIHGCLVYGYLSLQQLDFQIQQTSISLQSKCCPGLPESQNLVRCLVYSSQNPSLEGCSRMFLDIQDKQRLYNPLFVLYIVSQIFSSILFLITFALLLDSW